MVADLIRWKLAKRPPLEQISKYISGFIDGIGSLEQAAEKIVITLPGTPSCLLYDSCEFELNPEGCAIRQIEIYLKDPDGLIVEWKVQDGLTRAVAQGLSNLFYGLQGYQDWEAESSEAAT